MMITQWELVGRLLVAAILGSAIGIERERIAWAAGLRTHMLVCVGAALVMVVSQFGFSDILGTPHVELDPSRIAAQVVSGIGFLGAGAILLRGEIVRGLTTAASLWTVAAIGLATGCGLYIISAAATIIILVILAGIRPIERHYFGKQPHEIKLLIERGASSLHAIHQALASNNGQIKTFTVEPDDTTPEMDQVVIAMARIPDSQFQALCAQLKKITGVKDLQSQSKDV
jgi:putative Mg2+ transporter-C (MgtC) family protein